MTSIESPTARELHSQSEHQREGGDLEGALLTLMSAQSAYIKAGDPRGLSECLASEVLAYRHLSERSGHKEYLDFALRAAKLSVDFAEKSGQKEALALPYHTLGKIYEDLENWPEAVNAQAKAIDAMTNNPPQEHNRPAYINEMRVHWLADRYMSGEKEVIGDLDKVLDALESDTVEPRYNRDVWLSGGYMSKATILKDDNPDEAKKAFVKAGEIIKANSDLRLRKDQWNKKASSFSVSEMD